MYICKFVCKKELLHRRGSFISSHCVYLYVSSICALESFLNIYIMIYFVRDECLSRWVSNSDLIGLISLFYERKCLLDFRFVYIFGAVDWHCRRNEPNLRAMEF